MLQLQWKCVSFSVKFTKDIPNYALCCPLIVECFYLVLEVKVSLCTIFFGTPCSSFSSSWTKYNMELFRSCADFCWQVRLVVEAIKLFTAIYANTLQILKKLFYKLWQTFWLVPVQNQDIHILSHPYCWLEV